MVTSASREHSDSGMVLAPQVLPSDMGQQANPPLRMTLPVLPLRFARARVQPPAFPLSRSLNSRTQATLHQCNNRQVPRYTTSLMFLTMLRCKPYILILRAGSLRNRPSRFRAKLIVYLMGPALQHHIPRRNTSFHPYQRRQCHNQAFSIAQCPGRTIC